MIWHCATPFNSSVYSVDHPVWTFSSALHRFLSHSAPPTKYIRSYLMHWRTSNVPYLTLFIDKLHVHRIFNLFSVFICCVHHDAEFRWMRALNRDEEWKPTVSSMVSVSCGYLRSDIDIHSSHWSRTIFSIKQKQNHCGTLWSGRFRFVATKGAFNSQLISDCNRPIRNTNKINNRTCIVYHWRKNNNKKNIRGMSVLLNYPIFTFIFLGFVFDFQQSIDHARNVLYNVKICIQHTLCDAPVGPNQIGLSTCSDLKIEMLCTKCHHAHAQHRNDDSHGHELNDIRRHNCVMNEMYVWCVWDVKWWMRVAVGKRVDGSNSHRKCGHSDSSRSTA